uniref:SFRICE_005141 n=1 Tax=Spodoptera frugiperda TaxID=7108 RepID=A0A2H1V4F2_SPOFR
MEQDLERAEERAEQSDCKIVELEEELRVVGNNLKSLEVSEEKATQREETYEGQVKLLDAQLKELDKMNKTFSTISKLFLCLRLTDAILWKVYSHNMAAACRWHAMASREHVEDKIHSLSQKLSQAEARAEFAERSVQKLQKEVDRLEDDLVAEREKSKLLQEEMEATLHDIQNM